MYIQPIPFFRTLVGIRWELILLRSSSLTNPLSTGLLRKGLRLGVFCDERNTNRGVIVALGSESGTKPRDAHNQYNRSKGVIMVLPNLEYTIVYPVT